VPIHTLMVWLPLLLLGGGGAFVCGAVMLGLRAVRALERRGTTAAELAALTERVQVLEDALEAQTEEMRRLGDGVRFTERLLSERGVDEEGRSGSPPAT